MASKKDDKIDTGSRDSSSSPVRTGASASAGETASGKKSDSPIPELSKEEEGQKRNSYVTRESLKEKHRKEVEEIKEEFLSKSLKEKRKLYKCKEKFTTLENVSTWPEFFDSKLKGDAKMTKWWKMNSKKVKVDVNEDLNRKMSLFRGDITTLEIDAIANAANESLLGGGGVDGAIHAAAGPHLRSECETLHGCEPGDAKITCGYKLPAKYVVHTVGPRGERPAVLKRCYTNSLNLLKENNLKSIAFPCISTGIFGYPNKNAADVALSTIREWLEKDPYSKNVERIIMCLFLPVDVEVYNELMQLYFPLDRSVDASDNKGADSDSAEEEGKSSKAQKEKSSAPDKTKSKED